MGINTHVDRSNIRDLSFIESEDPQSIAVTEEEKVFLEEVFDISFSWEFDDENINFNNDMDIRNNGDYTGHLQALLLIMK